MLRAPAVRGRLVGAGQSTQPGLGVPSTESAVDRLCERRLGRGRSRLRSGCHGDAGPPAAGACPDLDRGSGRPFTGHGLRMAARRFRPAPSTLLFRRLRIHADRRRIDRSEIGQNEERRPEGRLSVVCRVRSPLGFRSRRRRLGRGGVGGGRLGRSGAGFRRGGAFSGRSFTFSSGRSGGARLAGGVRRRDGETGRALRAQPGDQVDAGLLVADAGEGHLGARHIAARRVDEVIQLVIVPGRGFGLMLGHGVRIGEARAVHGGAADHGEQVRADAVGAARVDGVAGLATREGGFTGGQVGGRQDRAPVDRQGGFGRARSRFIRRVDEMSPPTAKRRSGVFLRGRLLHASATFATGPDVSGRFRTHGDHESADPDSCPYGLNASARQTAGRHCRQADDRAGVGAGHGLGFPRRRGGGRPGDRRGGAGGGRRGCADRSRPAQRLGPHPGGGPGGRRRRPAARWPFRRHRPDWARAAPRPAPSAASARSATASRPKWPPPAPPASAPDRRAGGWRSAPASWPPRPRGSAPADRWPPAPDRRRSRRGCGRSSGLRPSCPPSSARTGRWSGCGRPDPACRAPWPSRPPRRARPEPAPDPAATGRHVRTLRPRGKSAPAPPARSSCLRARRRGPDGRPEPPARPGADLVAGLDRRVADAFQDVADVVDAGVRRCVHLHHVHVLARHDGGVVPPVGAQGQGRLVDRLGFIVERAGQQAGRRRLADAPHPGQHEGVGDTPGGEGVGQGADHRLLPDQILERARPVFAGQDGVGLALGGRRLESLGSGRRLGLRLRFRRGFGRGGRRSGRRRGAEHVVGVGVALLDFGRVFLPRGTIETVIGVAHGPVLARRGAVAHPLAPQRGSEIGGQLAAVVADLLDHLLVQPDIHAGAVRLVAGIAQFVGQLLALSQRGLQADQLHQVDDGGAPVQLLRALLVHEVEDAGDIDLGCGLGRDGGCGGRGRRGRGRRFGGGGCGRRLLLLEDAAENLAENAHSPAPERDEALSADEARAGSVKLGRRTCRDLGRFLEVEAGRAGEQVLVRAVAQVHDEVRLDIAVGEELGLHARRVETRHRAHVQTQGACGDGQIAALQRGVAEGGFTTARFFREPVAGAWRMREQLGQGLVEVDVLGDDQIDRRGQGLGAVALGHVRRQPGLGLGRGDEDEAGGGHVDRRRAELGQIVELADQGLGHGAIAPAVARARLGEQLGQDRPAGQAAGHGPALGPARGARPAEAARAAAGPAGGVSGRDGGQGRQLLGLRLARHARSLLGLFGSGARQHPDLRGRRGRRFVGHGALGRLSRQVPCAGRPAVRPGRRRPGATAHRRADRPGQRRRDGRRRGARGRPGPARHGRRPDDGPLPGRAPVGGGCAGHLAGARRARRRRVGLAGRRHHHPGLAGATARLGPSPDPSPHHPVAQRLGVFQGEGQGGGVAAPGADRIGHDRAALADRQGRARGGVQRGLVLDLGVQASAHQDHLHREPGPQQEAHGRRQRAVGIGAHESGQEPAEQEGHQQAQARREQRPRRQPAPARPRPARSQPIDQGQRPDIAEEQKRPAQRRQIGPLVLQAEHGQHHGHADHQGRTQHHRRHGRDGEAHAHQIVDHDIAPLDLVIGEVQAVEEGLDPPIGRPQRQQQGPDQGEGQLAGGIARQARHLCPEKLSHIRRQHFIEEAELPPGVRRIGEQAVDGDEGAQRREQGQQQEEGHAPGDETDAVAEIAHDGAPQDVDPALVRNLQRALGQATPAGVVGVIVLGRGIARWQGLGPLGPQLQAEAMALSVEQMRRRRARRQSARRGGQIAQHPARRAV
uniref:LigA n=1 Tax=Parastrongyloides trichosuri TaxID=131310 RepID=A0A0N4ZD58_PARTI